MARLPTVETLGARPTPNPQRGVVPFRADIAQTAQAAALRNAPNPLAVVADVVIEVLYTAAGVAGPDDDESWANFWPRHGSSRWWAGCR